VVMLDRRPVGYVHQDDIVDRFVAGDVVMSGSDFAMRPPVTELQARDIIRTPALLIDENQRLSEAVSVMASHGRDLGVVMHEDETPVGMLTVVEVAMQLEAALSHG
jgi:predicted transcriptional regulator